MYIYIYFPHSLCSREIFAGFRAFQEKKRQFCSRGRGTTGRVTTYIREKSEKMLQSDTAMLRGVS